MSEAWSYVQNGTTQGPLSREALLELLASGALTGEDLVWCQGMAAWAKAAAVPQLGLAPLPPPPPGPVPEFRDPFQPPRSALVMDPEAPGFDSQAAVLESLRATRPWVRLMGVLGILFIALMVVVALVMLAVSQGPLQNLPSALRVILPVIYLVLAGLHVPPAYFLNRYASRITTFLASGSPQHLASAVEAQKSFWKYVGIFTLVILVFYGLLILGGVGAAMVAAGRHRF